MTAADRILHARIMRRAGDLTPEMASAILRAFQNVRDSLSDDEVRRLVQLGGAERLYAQILTQAVIDVAFAPVRDRLRRSVMESVKIYGTTIPPTVRGTVGISFDFLNPRMLDAIRELETKVITSLVADARETVRLVAEQAIRDGTPARVWAKAIREHVGLGPTQLQEVQNYRDALLGQNGRVVTDYFKRDRRFDRGAMTPERVDKAVAAYTKRRIALNAETTARTAALDAQKAAQQLSWEDAISKGVVQRGELVKRWAGVLDDRERDEHLAMEGETVPFADTFSNREMIPGESTWNCRCVAVVELAA